MTTTMQLIAKQTVGAGGTTGITFSNIPQTYDDLKIVISARLTNTSYGETIRVKPNGSAANGFSRVLRAYGTGVSAYRVSWISATNNALGDGAVAGAFTSIQMYCTNYASSGYKSFSTESASPNNTTDGRLELASSLWSDNTAITSISFDNNAGTPFAFKEGSTFYLYGISKNTTTQATTVPYASGGDVITTDGTYWYHAFINSGTFIPLKSLDASVLVVGGGGGGGSTDAGGGGAGELDLFASQALSATNCNVVIGAGGAGGVGVGGTGQPGSQGGTSYFYGTSTVTALGGGGGGGQANGLGGNGGSGGGGAGFPTASAGGSASGSNTNAGGQGNASAPNYGAGGGGGATSAGGNGTSTAGGAGGNGYALTSIDSNLTSANFAFLTGMTHLSAGGGGCTDNGGTAGAGGSSGQGGAGSNVTNVAGNPGVSFGSGGGGGAGGGSNPAGGKGKQGLVIVRYAV